MVTTEENNKIFQQNNPQYFTAPSPGQTTTDPSQMARNRASLVSGSGGTLREENGKVVPSISSSNGVTAINDAVAQHTADITAATPTSKEDKPIAEKPTQTKNLAMEAVGAITPEEANATGVNIADYTYDTNTGYLVPKNNTQGANNTNAQFDADEKEVKDTFSSFMASMDASTQNLIKTYQNTFAERIAEEKKATESAVRSANTTNLRTGISRYAPGQAQSVLTNVERQGLDRIRKIGIEEAGLIAKAQESLQDKKFDLFMDQREELKTIRKERRAKIDELQKEATKKLEEVRKQQIQASRDETIAGLVAQGITDPNEILGLLSESAAASGYKSDFTADEIGKALKILKPDDALKDLSADFKTYSYLKKIGDPAVSGLSYFQYEAAIANAKRKPDGVEEDKPITITNEKKTDLIGAGFSQSDIQNIEKDVQQHGLDKVLEGITDVAQKKALQKTYGAKEKVTRSQLDSIVTAKMAHDGLKDTYTTDELKDLADEAGVSSMWTGADADVDRFLNSSEAKKIYADLLFKQYEEAGMTEKE